MIRADVMRRPRWLLAMLVRVGDSKRVERAGDDKRFSWFRLASERGWDPISSSVSSLESTYQLVISPLGAEQLSFAIY
jgi:hypothetical protein